MLRRLRLQGGMTLVEVVSAIFVFSLVAMGTFPLIASSIRGSNLSRSYTVGKTLAVKAMERVRGLPYSLNQLGVVDVLDMYLPNAQAPGYDAGFYTTACTSSSTNPACPRDIPEEYTITFRAAFVPVGGGAPIVVTPAQYSGPNVPKDMLPSAMIDMAVTASWSFPGDDEKYTIRTLVGDRKFATLKFEGVGTIDYPVQAITSLTSTTTAGKIVARGGTSDSRVSMRVSPQADQFVRSGLLRLEYGPIATPTITEFEGASATLNGPPSGTQADVSQTAGALMFESTPLAGLDANEVGDPDLPLPGDLAVGTDNEVPFAHGGFTFFPGTGNSDPDLWLDNVAARRPGDLALSSARLFQLRSKLGETLGGYTSATTRALDAADRGVYSLAHAEFKDLRLFPTTFAPDAVIQIDDFVADVSCSSTVSASADASRSWSARIRYWVEPDGPTVGGYSAWTDIGGSSVTDVLAQIQAINPLMYEENNNDQSGTGKDDAYLFPVSHDHPWLSQPNKTAHHDHPGYLQSWDMLENLGPGTEDAAGRVTEASIDNAITIVTAPLETTLNIDMPITVAIGSLGCRATDNR